LHGLSVGSRATAALLYDLFSSHSCLDCHDFVTIFSVSKPVIKLLPNKTKNEEIGEKIKKHLHNFKLNIPQKKDKKGTKKSTEIGNFAATFPPPPLTRSLAHSIISGACKKMSHANIEEAGCAVCGQLTSMNQLSSLKNVKNHLHVLKAPGFSRLERHSETDPLKEYPVVMDHSCKHVCNHCRAALRQGKVPKYALAKGLWIGAVPKELSSLRLVERMLVAKVRHSCCSIKIASGMRKMKANAIAFPSPITKVYD
ncbi:hypothetical protein F5887DRAFT_850699, partial [Amanita rubescens]